MATSVSTALVPSAADNELAQQGYAILKKYCYRCHGIDFKVPGMNVLDLDTLTAGPPGRDPYLIVGKPDKSLISGRAWASTPTCRPTTLPIGPRMRRRSCSSAGSARGPVPRPRRPAVPRRAAGDGGHSRPPDQGQRLGSAVPAILHAHQPVQQPQARHRRRDAAVPGRPVEAGQQPELAARDRRARRPSMRSRRSSPSTCATSAGTRTTCGRKSSRSIPTA